MTQEQQDNLRRALYNAKFTTDAEDENPFVGGYFYDLLDILHDYVAKMYHEGWLAGEANLAKEYKHIQWINWIPVEKELPKEGQVVVIHTKGGSVSTACYTDGRFDITEWFEAINVTHWMEIVPPQGKEDKNETRSKSRRNSL